MDSYNRTWQAMSPVHNFFFNPIIFILGTTYLVIIRRESLRFFSKSFNDQMALTSLTSREIWPTLLLFPIGFLVSVATTGKAFDLVGRILAAESIVIPPYYGAIADTIGPHAYMSRYPPLHALYTSHILLEIRGQLTNLAGQFIAIASCTIWVIIIGGRNGVWWRLFAGLGAYAVGSRLPALIATWITDPEEWYPPGEMAYIWTAFVTHSLLFILGLYVLRTKFDLKQSSRD